MSSLPPRLYWNLRHYPSHQEYENQWGEHGWLYDPEADRYVRYDIDRKCQTDSVLASLTRDAFAEQVRPRAKAALRRWFDGIAALRDGDQVWVRSGGRLRRYGAAAPDDRGRPIAAVEDVEPDAAPAHVRAWLASA